MSYGWGRRGKKGRHRNGPDVPRSLRLLVHYFTPQCCLDVEVQWRQRGEQGFIMAEKKHVVKSKLWTLYVTILHFNSHFAQYMHHEIMYYNNQPPDATAQCRPEIN